MNLGFRRLHTSELRRVLALTDPFNEPVTQHPSSAT